jgi:hypothetical protein
VIARALMGAITIMGMAVGAFCLVATYAPRLLYRLYGGQRRLARRLTGPHPDGRPIEVIAADLRHLIEEHRRLLADRSEWYVTHGSRVNERNVHDVIEEAASALGLESCPAALGGWTSTHLAVRLRQLSEAGLVLPQHAWDDGR